MSFRIVVSTLFVSMGLAACTSTGGGQAASYGIKYSGQCGALYNGEALVTTYNRKSKRTTAYAIGKGCKNSHPRGEEVNFTTFDTMQIEGAFVRGMRTNKEGVTRRTIIRKDGARYAARSAVVK
ncbi:hypothetical protein D4A92_22810 (plasmid) [Rhizobium rosettiformans]|uniref:Lipoprotein n=1 Tax=Rhizobium rosettiformans TaxID=1368430 RepID=A0ABX7F221_9HYPH|nr:hypothetical protein [Rhizobium rosettiformans]QRF54352.1 hypothetical protein D4A92_22810 [Rhizobium rosettiformans]